MGESLELRVLEDTVKDLTVQKDGAYRERNALVCLLSKVFPASLQNHVLKDGEEWDEDWRKVVFIELPTGQATWHIHRAEEPFFAHLEDMRWTWDGHTTDEKYSRIAAIDSRYLCIVDFEKISTDEIDGLIDVLEKNWPTNK